MSQRVHIEFSRVQTWLFAVRHLRAMVGANALLGETLRVVLPKLARDTGRGWMLALLDAQPRAIDGEFEKQSKQLKKSASPPRARREEGEEVPVRRMNVSLRRMQLPAALTFAPTRLPFRPTLPTDPILGAGRFG